MPGLATPGVYAGARSAAPAAQLSTGVPVFLGRAGHGPSSEPQRLRRWSEFTEIFESADVAAKAGHFLAFAVQGFFANGGSLCYALRLHEASGERPLDWVRAGLAATDDLDDVDLVCLPDAGGLRPHGTAHWGREDVFELQRAVTRHCERHGTRVAILDALAGADDASVRAQRKALASPNAALYHPWISAPIPAPPDGGFGLPRLAGEGLTRLGPPCGHIAGIYATTDRRYGVHRAPANAIIEGALDVERRLSADVESELSELGVNCLRALRHRGVRPWGARTLANDPVWRHVGVRRLVLTAVRWIELNLTHVVFEPNRPELWGQVHRELEAYCRSLYERGALAGGSAVEAFYVRCDAETNAGHEPGRVVAEVGLAVAVPAEFIFVSFVQEAAGVSVLGPHIPTR